MAANYNTYNSNSSDTVTLTKPDDVAAGDYLLIYVTVVDSDSDPTTGPSGFGTRIARRVGDAPRSWVYGKIAGSDEPEYYTVEWASAGYVSGVVLRIPSGDFDADDPIDVISNTDYITGDDKLRAAAVTVANDNSISVFLGSAQNTSSRTITNPDGFEAIVKWGSYINSDTYSTACKKTFDASNTGTIDGTISANEDDKHAYLIVFNPEPIATVDIPAVSGVTAPVTGQTLDTAITANAQVASGSITWSPAHSTAAANTEYTATITMTAAEGYTFTGVAANFFTVSGATTDTNPADSGVVTAVFPTTAATVTTLDIPGVTVPAAGVAPDTTVTETSQYTGVVSWSPSTNPHPAGTVCTATITLTAKSGYTFHGVAANSFTVSGATATNTINTGVITAEFPATASTVTDLSIGGVTAPVAGATPVSTITSETQFTGSVSWSPTPTGGVFQPGVTYTANITRTAASGYTFYGFAADSATVAGATVTNSINSGSAAAVFPTTASTITLIELAGIEVPELGNSQDTAGTETAQYTVSIDSYSPDDDPLEAATAYTLGITVTPKAGWTLFGLSANTFTVSSATVTHSANSGAVSALFGETSSPVTISAITGVTPPVTNETPVSTITATAEFTGTCAWSPNNTTFRPGTEYTVVITLTAEDGYSFSEVTEDFFTVAGATATNDAGSGIVTAVFPATEPGTYARPGFFFQGI